MSDFSKKIPAKAQKSAQFPFKAPQSQPPFKGRTQGRFEPFASFDNTEGFTPEFQARFEFSPDQNGFDPAGFNGPTSPAEGFDSGASAPNFKREAPSKNFGFPAQVFRGAAAQRFGIVVAALFVALLFAKFAHAQPHLSSHQAENHLHSTAADVHLVSHHVHLQLNHRNEAHHLAI